MSKCIYENTYWNHKGRHEWTAAALHELVPRSGEVKDSDKNPRLELYRRATNCYHDLYNNGLCNRDDEFFEIFGFDGRSEELTKETVSKTERKMNAIIRAAAKEQGIKPKPLPRKDSK